MNKVCIIGCGMIAQSAHIPAYKQYSDDFEIVAVCDAFEASAKKVSEEFEIPNYITKIGEHAFYACGSLESITNSLSL